MKSMFRRWTRGQVAVLYAAGAALLIGALSLGADVAVMFVNWELGQRAADAAALAGANYQNTGMTYTETVDSSCTSQPDDASKAACTTAVKNGMTAGSNAYGGNVQITISEPTAQTLKVLIQQTNLPYFFGKALGMSNYEVDAVAVAQAPGNIQTVTQGLFPMAVQCTSPCSGLTDLDPSQSGFVPGQPVPLGEKFVGGLAPGNWQWMSLGGTGGSQLNSNIINGATGSYTIGDLLQSATGLKVGPVNSAFSTRFNTCNSISDPCGAIAKNPNNIPIGDPCRVVMPAVDFKGCTGNCTNLKIEGFALIYLETDSTATNVDGCFVSEIMQHTIAGSTAPDLGGLVIDALVQ